MQLGDIRKEINDLPHNVKVCVGVLPLWAIPNGFVTSYASLYMLDQGMSAAQVGTINSVCFVAKTVLALFAGYIINRMGRRRAAGILDMIGWALPMLIFALSSKPWHFMLASLINCLVTINGVATSCLMVEDVPKDRRLLSNRYSNIVSSLCTLFVPISGILINRLTLVPAMRMLYAFAAISMFLAAFGKLRFIRETTVGKELMNPKNLDINPLKVLPRQMRFLLANKQLLMLFSLNLVMHFALDVNRLFYFPYLTQYLHFSELQVSFFPVATTIISLAVYFMVIPRIKNMMRGLLGSVLLYCGGALALVASSVGGRLLAYLCVLLWAVAGATLTPVLNTTIANSIDDKIRTEMLSFFNVLSMLCMFPAGAFGGWLYDRSPLFPVFFVLAMYIAALVALTLFQRQWEKAAK